jgi:hypothetical protein
VGGAGAGAGSAAAMDSLALPMILVVGGLGRAKQLKSHAFNLIFLSLPFFLRLFLITHLENLLHWFWIRFSLGSLFSAFVGSRIHEIFLMVVLLHMYNNISNIIYIYFMTYSI